MEIIRLTGNGNGNGWGDAMLLRGAKGASVRGRTGPITEAIRRGAKTGRLLDGGPTR